HVTQGTRVLAVVDGIGGDSGSATLDVSAVTCPAIQLTTALLPVEHSTVGRDVYPMMGCTEDAFGARTYRFTAPEDGHYSFVALGRAGFQPSLMLEEGPACGGAVLQCNRAHDDLRAEVLRSLRAGEHVTIVISGSEGEGTFLLDVTRTDHVSH